MDGWRRSQISICLSFLPKRNLSERSLRDALGLLTRPFFAKGVNKLYVLINRGLNAQNNEPKTPINAIFTNRIASKLTQQGFNVQKVHVANLGDKAEVGSVLEASGAKILITGDLKEFFVKSFDAMMESAKGQAAFSIKVVDAGGSTIFDKPFVGNAEHFIGLTGQFGSDEAIDKTINASIDRLFSDSEFQSILKDLNRP